MCGVRPGRLCWIITCLEAARIFSGISRDCFFVSRLDFFSANVSSVGSLGASTACFPLAVLLEGLFFCGRRQVFGTREKNTFVDEVGLPDTKPCVFGYLLDLTSRELNAVVDEQLQLQHPMDRFAVHVSSMALQMVRSPVSTLCTAATTLRSRTCFVMLEVPCSTATERHSDAPRPSTNRQPLWLGHSARA